MEAIKKIFAELENLRRQVNLIRKGLIRLGKVQSVDTVTCTVVVEFPGSNTAGAPSTSLPVPWLQRSTEHRPPTVGDHAIVIDPSLGNGAGLAITGWPSVANLSPGVTSSDHTLYSGTDACKVQTTGAVGVVSPDISLGVAPVDFVALAAKVDAELTLIWSILTAPVVPAPPAGVDAGEPGLTALLAAANTASASRLTVAATQVKAQ